VIVKPKSVSELLCTHSPLSSRAYTTHSLDSQHPSTASFNNITISGTESQLSADTSEVWEVDGDDGSGMAWVHKQTEVREKVGTAGEQGETYSEILSMANLADTY
jgi:hypothetical protein